MYFKRFILNFLYDIDMFGKEPQLYYKSDQKKHSITGIFFSILLIIITIIFFIFKLVKLINKTSLTFSETSQYLEEPPSIKINKDNFYGGFALEHPITYDPIIDERIYYPKAYFKKQKRNGHNWDLDIKELELEPCKLENFGEKFKNKVVNNELSNLYCPKKLEDTLMGHFSYDEYSYLYVEFFPCINSTENNNHCKPEEEIDFYLRNTFVCFEMEDVELTPRDYDNPVIGRNQDIYFTVGKKLFQEIHVFYQIVYIETDLDIIGFEDISNIKKQEYLKYYSTVQMTNLIENNIYKTGEAFSAVTIKLFDFVRTQRRTYSKLIDILGDVGGVMEIVFSLFQIISSVITNILYEISLVNNLFEFDIINKKVKIKNDKCKIEIKKDIINNLNVNIPSRLTFKKNRTHRLAISNIKSEEGYAFTTSGNRLTRLGKKGNSTRNLKNFILSQDGKKINKNNENIIQKNETVNINKQMTNIDDKNDKFESNNKIKINKICIFLCFCFIRKKNNVQNILLDEGMKIFKENMDIIKIFKKLIYLDENLNENKDFEISESSKDKLLKLDNYITNS